MSVYLTADPSSLHVVHREMAWFGFPQPEIADLNEPALPCGAWVFGVWDLGLRASQRRFQGLGHTGLRVTVLRLPFTAVPAHGVLALFARRRSHSNPETLLKMCFNPIALFLYSWVVYSGCVLSS